MGRANRRLSQHRDRHDFNLGSDIIQSLTSDDSRYEEMKAAVMAVVGGHFRPEFINRIDEVVVFHPLGSGQIQGIARIQLELLAKRLAEQECDIHFQ